MSYIGYKMEETAEGYLDKLSQKKGHALTTQDNYAFTWVMCRRLMVVPAKNKLKK
jgi:hypothetical protein